jgi:hypothetical protein
MFGNPRTLSVVGRRYQITENLTWQKGRHLLRFGFDWEHATATASNITQDPAALTLWSPARVRQLDPAILLPASFTTLDDVLQLPLQSFQTGVGPGTILQRGFSPTRVFDLYRFHGSDTWRVVDGRLMLMELELIEPELFLDHHPHAAARLASAVLRHLTHS